MSLLNNIREAIKKGYSTFKSKQDVDNFDEIVHNNEVFDVLDKPYENLEDGRHGAIVGTKEYYNILEENK